MKQKLTHKILALLLTMAMLIPTLGMGMAASAAEVPFVPAAATVVAAETDNAEATGPRIQILATSDLHGSFSDKSYSTGKASTGLARVAAKINELRDENTLLIDVGDTIQGNGTTVFISNSEVNVGGADKKWSDYTALYPVLQGMDVLDFDAWILGNHEFNFGLSALSAAYGDGETWQLDMPILAGNVVPVGVTGDTYTLKDAEFEPYIIRQFTIDGVAVDVAIIGMTHHNIVNWDKANMAAAGLTTVHPITATKRAIEQVRADHPDAIIVLAEHLDRVSGAEEVLSDSYIAENVAVFIGGHGHASVAGVASNGVKYVERMDAGRQLSQISLNLTLADGKWVVADKIDDVVVSNLDFSTSSPVDEGYMADSMIAAADAFGVANCTTVVGELTGGPLVPAATMKNNYQAYLEDNALTDLINNAMLHYVNEYAEETDLAAAYPEYAGLLPVTIAGTAPLDENANAQPGELTKGGVASIYKYDNNTLYLVAITGAQIQDWVEWSHSYLHTLQEGDLTVGYGYGDGAPPAGGHNRGYNVDQFVGFDYTVDLTKEFGERVAMTVSGSDEAFDLDATYLVAVNNYRASSQLSALSNGSNPIFGTKYTAEQLPKILAMDIETSYPGTGEGMLGVMISYIQDVKGGVIDNSYTTNWELIVPEADSADVERAIALVNDGTIDNVLAADRYPGIRPIHQSELDQSTTANAGDLVILYTNDTHGRDMSSSSSVGTAGVAALKQSYEAQGYGVLLLSAGDATQGTPLVNEDQGKSAIRFMEAAGYNFMAPGNHEFDWGRANLENILAEEATFRVSAANIFDQATGALAFPGDGGNGYVIYEVGGQKVGVFGLTTPESATKAHPDKIAGLRFAAGQEMYNIAQAQVDALNAAGVDLVICVAHLGVDASSMSNRSEDVIANVSGIDLFVDGHSHTVIDGRLVTNKGGGATTLVQTGAQLANVGAAVVSGGTITNTLISAKDWNTLDAGVDAVVTARNAEVTEALSGVVGTTEVVLYGENVPEAPGVRVSATNMGDFATDALLWMAREVYGAGNVDLALTNGGGIRDSIPADPSTPVSAGAPYSITKSDMVTVFPFGNMLTLITVTGAQLLEALEAATFSTPTSVGAFPQVSGISFEIHTYVPWEQGAQYAGSTYYAPANPGARIQNVMVGGQPLHLNREYTIATNDFTAAGGDTYGVFKNATNFRYTGVAMEEALYAYLAEIGTITAASAYSNWSGQGRIAIVNENPNAVSEVVDPVEDAATAPKTGEETAPVAVLFVSLFGLAAAGYGYLTLRRRETV